MATTSTPHFKNDDGVSTITIGVKEFQCMGASAPFDHPHVFLDMGDEDEIVCPYCSTLYKHDSSLGVEASRPAGAFVSADIVAA